MDRGIIVGGGLIAASFLVAALLNRSAHEETPPARAIPEPPAHVCPDPRQLAPGATPAREDDWEKCERQPAESAER
jgi:hypothetical protein